MPTFPVRRTLAAGGLLLLATAARAQQPTPAPTAPAVTYLPAAALAAVADTLHRQHTVSRLLGDRGSYQYILVRRDSTGAPEVHARWTDVIVVQSGRATVLTGGRLTGSHEESPGETRGGTLADAAAQPVRAGDLLVIRAGVPHQVQLPSGGSVRYLAIKVPEQTAR